MEPTSSSPPPASSLLTPPAQTIPFITLPPEIRNTIYQLTLIHSAPIDLWPVKPTEPRDFCLVRGHPEYNSQARFHNPHRYALATSCAPAFLLTCRVVNAEAPVFLYGHNTFIFADLYPWTVAFNWLNMIGPSNRRYVRDLILTPPDLESTKSILRRCWVNNSPRILRETVLELKEIKLAAADLEIRSLPQDDDTYFQEMCNLLRDAKGLHRLRIVVKTSAPTRVDLQQMLSDMPYESLETLRETCPRLQLGVLVLDQAPMSRQWWRPAEPRWGFEMRRVQQAMENGWQFAYKYAPLHKVAEAVGSAIDITGLLREGETGLNEVARLRSMGHEWKDDQPASCDCRYCVQSRVARRRRS